MKAQSKTRKKKYKIISKYTEKTKKAMLESREKKGLGRAVSMDDFWKQMEITGFCKEFL